MSWYVTHSLFLNTFGIVINTDITRDDNNV